MTSVETGELKEKIKNNLSKLINHPVLNKNFFVHDDQELIKSYLETALILINNEQFEGNINFFLQLYSSQVDTLADDFEKLLKLREVNSENEVNGTIVRNKNFLQDPLDNSSQISFERNQNIIILVHNIKNGVASLVDVGKHFKNLYDSVNGTLPKYLEDILKQVNDELVSFKRLRNIADNAKTEDIYNSAVNKYKQLENAYRKKFYWAIFIVSSVSIGLLLGKAFITHSLELSISEFWALKISVILIGIVLITYFLKQSSHYQYLADQNYQTQIELQAFPTFMESIPTEEAASVRKELALKYFGRDIDSTPHKDIANLISDQMKNTTEMVKAATDVLKVKGKE